MKIKERSAVVVILQNIGRYSIFTLFSFSTLIVVFLSHQIWATDVSGPITANTTWTVANSPYVVVGNALVMDGVTLTIEAGVQVEFQNGICLQIDGELIARGVNGIPIVFTSNETSPSPGDWGYILFTDTSIDAVFDGGGNYVSGSILEYCVIEYAGGLTVSGNGGLRINSSSPFVKDCSIRNNSERGIMIWENFLDVKIENTTITENSSSSSGGGGGIYIWHGSISVSNSHIIDNVVSGNGGGIHGYIADLTMVNCIVSNNTSSGNGGGISYLGCNGEAFVINGSTIEGNSADIGGGIYIPTNCYNFDVSIENSYIVNNFAFSGGGGIYTGRGRIDISNNYVMYNETDGFGGGILIGDNDNGGNTLDIVGNIIFDNSAIGHGGGIYRNGTDRIVTISNNVISGNSTEGEGGGIYGLGRDSGGFKRTIILTHNTIHGNSAADLAAMALHYESNENCQFNTVVDNVSISSKNIYLLGFPNLNYNNFFGNVATYELFNDNAHGTGNVNAQDNWWGTTSEPEIQLQIYDWFDDGTKSIVDYGSYQTSPNTAAPISPPLGLTVTPSGFSVSLNWLANPESDIAGYRVWYDTDSGYPYEGAGAVEGNSGVDVGNVTSFTLSGLTLSVTYYITVSAYDAGGDESWYAQEKSVVLFVCEDPTEAAFSGGPTSGCAPLDVCFTDQSTGGPTSWNWDFGDVNSSTQQNPCYTYTTIGQYTVSLTVSGPCGSDTEIKQDYVVCDCQCPGGKGDVNCVENVTMSDALCAFKRFIYGDPTWTHAELQECACECSEWAADANCNGAITPQDALCIGWRSLMGDWHDPQPGDNCGCVAGPKVVGEISQHAASVSLASFEAAPGQRVRIPVIMDHPQSLDAFGLKLSYPAGLLECIEVLKTPVTEEWLALGGVVTEEGILRLGGFHTEPVSKNGSVVMLEVVFEVKNGVVGEGQLAFVELVDDIAGVEANEAAVKVEAIPTNFALEQNYPNPFNPTTDIRYQLADTGSPVHITLKIYNILGHEVKTLENELKNSGYYTVTWDGRDEYGQEVASGVYIYRIETANFVQTKRMLLMK